MANGDNTHHHDHAATGPISRYFSNDRTRPRPNKYMFNSKKRTFDE
jgi:hypothetical protein